MGKNKQPTFEWIWKNARWYERLLLVLGPGLFLAELVLMALGLLK